MSRRPAWKAAVWSLAEDKRLRLLSHLPPYSHEIVAFFPGRTRNQIIQRRETLKEKAPFRRKWSSEDDAKILRMREEGAVFPEIAQEFPGARAINVRNRWLVLQPGIRVGRWTEEERKACFEAYKIHGRDYSALARAVGTRSSKQCGDLIAIGRHSSALPPIISEGRKRRSWTTRELNILREGVQELGHNSWRTISERLYNVHSPYVCRYRWQQGIPTNFAIRKWEAVDLTALSHAVLRYGTNDWVSVSKEVGWIPDDCQAEWERGEVGVSKEEMTVGDLIWQELAKESLESRSNEKAEESDIGDGSKPPSTSP